MKTFRFTESQIIAILKHAEAGTPVPELCREHGMSNGSFYKWRSTSGGTNAARTRHERGVNEAHESAGSRERST